MKVLKHHNFLELKIMMQKQIINEIDSYGGSENHGCEVNNMGPCCVYWPLGILAVGSDRELCHQLVCNCISFT